MQFQPEIQNKLPLWGVRLCITHTTATSGRIYPYRAAKQQAARGCSRCRVPYVAFARTGLRSSKRPEVAVAVVRRMSYVWKD